MLNQNLELSGSYLVIDANLAYFDPVNRRLGINTTSPQYALDSSGNARIANLTILGNTITSNTGKIGLGSVSNITITGGSPNYILYTDGAGNLAFGNLNVLSGLEGFTGNNIILGSNTQPSLTSNAIALSTSTSVTDAIAELNYVLGKLVPPPPPTFPGANTLSISTSTTSGLMANFTQTDNSGWGNLSIAGGTLLNAVRVATYATSTNISAVGPGNNGTVTVYLNGTAAGANILVGGVNSTNSNLTISNNQDYHNVVSTVTGGFWYSFNASASGSSIPAGWNRVYITDTAGGPTNNATWYYDSSAPGTPTFTATNMVLSSNVVSYSSTVPHFTSAAGFTLTGNVNKLSGDMYPNSSTLVSTAVGGAFQAPVTVSYASAGVTTPLVRNLYVSSGSATFTTTANITTAGFGSATALVGPQLSVNNSYATGSQTYAPGVIVLYKNGTSTQIEETSLTIASIGTGSGNPYRIANPDAGTPTDTPAYTGSEAAFNSTTGPFYVTDATVVAAKLQYDVTNYSTGYLPVGPNLSSRGATAQYFTFKFVRGAVSKFNIAYTGAIAGLWVALPGSVIDGTSTLNGWLTLATPYAGSGIPGATGSGNGSNGCSFGGSATLNNPGTYSVTANFGTVSSSSTATNEIYVRVKLVSNQTLTALSIAAATN